MNRKIKFIFTVGVEGTGHHMLVAIMKNLLISPMFVGEGAWHSVLTEFWDPDNTSSNKDKPEVRRKFQEILRHYSSAGITHLYENASFP